jgi:hypothetical protein
MASDAGLLLLPGGKIIRGEKSRDPLNTGDVDVLRAGLLMGEITASGKYAPAIIGVLTEAYDKDGSLKLQMTVSAATATEIVRRIGTSGTFKITGPPTAAGTVATETITYSAVNTTTGVITISLASADFISGSFVQPTDGSEAPKGLINDGYGIKVTDADDANVDVPFPNLVIAGQVDASQIVNYPTDTSLIAWVKAQLRATGGSWTFDDGF